MPENKFQTRMYKNHYNNWVCKSITELVGNGGTYILEVHTSKTSNKELVTSASVALLATDGKSTLHSLFKDFSLILLRSTPKRITLHAVQEQHAKADLVALLSQVKAFYNIPEEPV